MSVSRSTRRGKSFSMDLAKKYVYSREVYAFIMPPTDSMAREMSTARRRGVPLKSMCSMKGAMPLSAGVFAGGTTRAPRPPPAPLVQPPASVAPRGRDRENGGEAARARKDLHEGAEIHDLADPPLVDLSHLGGLGDPLDDGDRRARRVGVPRGG